MRKTIGLALLLSLVSCKAARETSSTKEEAPAKQAAPVEERLPVKTGSVDVGDALIYYEEAGEGEALILLHGGFLTKEMWDGHFQEFAKKYRVVRYDARNHGLSKSQAVTFAHFADLNKLLEHLKIDKAVILGLSMGGYIAIDFALKYPDKVKGLILVAPGLSGFEMHGPESDAFNKKFEAALKTGNIDSIIEAFMEAWTYGPSRKAEDLDSALRDKVTRMARQTMETWNDQTKELVASPLAVGRLNEIKAPTLAIVGDLDMPNILEIVGLLEKNVPDFEKFVIRGAAHMLNLEKPEEFNKAVLDFLDKLT